MLKRLHRFAARLAIIAMLIDGLLPTAVSAAVRTGARTDTGRLSAPVCGAPAGTPLPPKEAPSLPSRHCALCAPCAAGLSGLSPARPIGPVVDRDLAGDAHPAAPLSSAAAARPVERGAARPRAPPYAVS